MHSPSTHPLLLIAGNANPALWQEISDNLGIPLTNTLVSRFSDGEIRVQVEESVRDAHCFILQSTCAPVNENLMELLILIDSLRRASAYTIAAVTPYSGYARQDKKVKPREPITARLVANLIEDTGAGRLMAMDLHSNSIQGFFNIPVDHLTAANLLCDYMYSDGWAEEDCVMVSPDVGGVLRTKYVADRLHLPIAIIAKRRSEPNKSEVIELVGDIEGKRAIMYDDMIDTAGSICNGAAQLMAHGAKAVRVFASHGIFSGEAVQRIQDSVIDLVTITNTIPQREDTTVDKIRYISVAPILAEAIRRNHMGMSIASLFR
jgi:ribose-phosphate pyrophosphokinase